MRGGNRRRKRSRPFRETLVTCRVACYGAAWWFAANPFAQSDSTQPPWGRIVGFRPTSAASRNDGPDALAKERRVHYKSHPLHCCALLDSSATTTFPASLTPNALIIHLFLLWTVVWAQWTLCVQPFLLGYCLALFAVIHQETRRGRLKVCLAGGLGFVLGRLFKQIVRHHPPSLTQRCTDSHPPPHLIALACRSHTVTA